MGVPCSVVEGESRLADYNTLVGRFKVAGLRHLRSGIIVTVAINASGITEVRTTCQECRWAEAVEIKYFTRPWTQLQRPDGAQINQPQSLHKHIEMLSPQCVLHEEQELQNSPQCVIRF